MAGKLKIAFIGAGSGTFCPLTMNDILLSDELNGRGLVICLMDLSEQAMQFNLSYAKHVAGLLGRGDTVIETTTSLERAVDGADFVISAFDRSKHHFWSMDFHIPRKYGSRQVFGENGGHGGMFHALRSIPAIVEIARAMEKGCPGSWMINYANPEAKLVEAVSRLTSVKAVGLCHGVGMGHDQLSQLLERPKESIESVACGLNHFGWFQEIKDAATGEDLYPLLRAQELRADKLAYWDEIALSRAMFRLYGLYPYPGANHIGEYIGWADEYFSGRLAQYYYDPIVEDPWKTGDTPAFIYSLSQEDNMLMRDLFPKPTDAPNWRERMMQRQRSDITQSHEVGVPIMEAMVSGRRTELAAVNRPNAGMIPGLPDEMVVELPAHADANGITTHQMKPLPDAITQMIRLQGTIHKLIIEAYVEKSKKKLLQAALIDPNASTYYNMVHMIDEMFERQADVLPEMHW